MKLIKIQIEVEVDAKSRKEALRKVRRSLREAGIDVNKAQVETIIKVDATLRDKE